MKKLLLILSILAGLAMTYGCRDKHQLVPSINYPLEKKAEPTIENSSRINPLCRPTCRPIGSCKPGRPQCD